MQACLHSHQCIVSYAWLMHGWSMIPEFCYLMCLFNLILKLCLYCRENIPFCCFFVFDIVSLLFCYLFVAILRKNFIAQSSSITGQENIWEFKMLTLNSLKFNKSNLNTLSQKLRQYCVVEEHRPFCNRFITSIQYGYHILKTFPNNLYM